MHVARSPWPPRAAACAAALAATLLPAAPAHAGPLGFSDPVVVGDVRAEQVAAAVGADGTAAVVAVSRDRRGRQLHVLHRQGARGPWTTIATARSRPLLRDPEVAVAPDGAVTAAWAEARRAGDDAVAILSVRGGARPRVRRLAVGTAYSAQPRIAVLRSGAVVVAFRDVARRRTSRLRAVRDGGRPRTLATRVAQFALAASGDGASVAWLQPLRWARERRRALTLRLGAGGRPVPQFPGHDAGPLVVSHDAAPALRVAGGPDGRAIAAWTRPARRGRRAAPFTRSLWPVARPARPVPTAPGERPVGTPVVAVGDTGRAVLAVRALGGEPPGFRLVSFGSQAGGVWARRRAHGAPSPMASTPRPVVLPDGEGLVVWAQARPREPEPVYDVLAARRAADGPGEEGQAIGTGLRTTDGRGVGVGQAGARVLVAWPAADGGVAVSERS